MNTLLLVFLLFQSVNISTQQRPPSRGTVLEEFVPNRPTNTPTSIDEDYVIGKDDLIEVGVFEVPELGGAARVSAGGTISLPLIGNIIASGKTPQQLERLIETELKKKYLNEPHVTVFVREYASQPVSILGAIRMPGMYQLKGQKSLLDMIAQAQGLSDSAGKTIQVIRRTRPDIGAEPQGELIAIDVEALQNGKIELNIPIYAGDVINVLNAGSVFVAGEVFRPGEFPLRYGKNVTISQAVALGGGTTKDAKKKNALLIRYHSDGTREEIEVNIQKIMERSGKDISMMPNDILLVPSNRIRTGFNRALDSFLAVAIGRAIYGR